MGAHRRHGSPPFRPRCPPGRTHVRPHRGRRVLPGLPALVRQRRGAAARRRRGGGPAAGGLPGRTLRIHDPQPQAPARVHGHRPGAGSVPALRGHLAPEAAVELGLPDRVRAELRFRPFGDGLAGQPGLPPHCRYAGGRLHPACRQRVRGRGGCRAAKRAASPAARHARSARAFGRPAGDADAAASARRHPPRVRPTRRPQPQNPFPEHKHHDRIRRLRGLARVATWPPN